MTVKEKAIEVITQMPDDSTLDDVGYELYVIESVEKGLAELDRERIPHPRAGESEASEVAEVKEIRWSRRTVRQVESFGEHIEIDG